MGSCGRGPACPARVRDAGPVAARAPRAPDPGHPAHGRQEARGPWVPGEPLPVLLRWCTPYLSPPPPHKSAEPEQAGIIWYSSKVAPVKRENVIQ